MRHAVGNVEEEGLSFVLFNELDGSLRVPRRELTLIRVRLNRAIAFDERQRRIRQSSRQIRGELAGIEAGSQDAICRKSPSRSLAS